MAEIKKFTSPAVKGVFIHANRTANDGHSHSNENIDLERTKNNYHLKTGSIEEWQKRRDDTFHIRRKNNVTFCEAVVTLPNDMTERDINEERKFFRSCYDFFSKDFGEDNIMYAVVHKDEITPHMHIGFIPVKEREVTFGDYTRTAYTNQLKEWVSKHNGELPKSVLMAKEVINREYLYTMHDRLQQHVDESLGYHTAVLNGATVHGNKTVLELKVKSLQEEKARLEESIEGYKDDAQNIKQTMNKIGITADQFELYPLLQQIDNLKEQNKALVDVLVRNNCSYKPNELRAKEIIPAKSSKLNVYEGSLVNEQLPENAVVVVEIPKHKEESPQQKLINADFDLRQMIAFAKNSDDDVRVKKSRTSERTFVLIKTDDNEKNTVNNLIVMEQMLREVENLQSRKIYMDRLASDRYDLAKSILASNNLQVAYFEEKNKIDKLLEEQREQEKVKE